MSRFGNLTVKTDLKLIVFFLLIFNVKLFLNRPHVSSF